jgi:hypothetical protein
LLTNGVLSGGRDRRTELFERVPGHRVQRRGLIGE